MSEAKPAYTYVSGQRVELVPTGFCQCTNPRDSYFLVCRYCGLQNAIVKTKRYWRI